MADALCLEHPEVEFFPGRGESSAPAKALCARCLCRAECLAYALVDPDLVGVWGGTSPRERAQLRLGKVSAPAA
jgi:WhiB family redox-sensing transcriptional regulator